MSKGVVLGRALANAEADKKESGDIIWTMFRCADLLCNKLLTVEDKAQGFCGGCQGVRFGVARYVTESEQAQIDAGTLHPVKVNCDEIGAEPPAPREVR
jgi:hypothetical protein